MKQADEELLDLTTSLDRQISTLVSEFLEQRVSDGYSPCNVYTILNDVLAQMVGRLEILHIESDLRGAGKSEQITKDMLIAAIGPIQINVIQSLNQGMEESLKTGGHYTIEDLKNEVVQEVTEAAKQPTLVPKKDDGGSNQGPTYH